MNILLINHYAGSNQHGMEYRPFYLAKEWNKLGHQVTIVAASFSHVRSVQPTITKDFTEEDIEGIKYIWINTPSYEGNGLKRVINMLTFIAKLFRYSLDLKQKNNPDIVIASSTYPLDIYPALYIANSNQAKLVFEVHDLWPLSPIELGKMSRWHPFIVVMQWAENFACVQSDYVVSMLPKAANYMQEHGMKKHKFNYIPNGVNIDEWKISQQSLPELHQQVIDKLQESGKFIIGYAGAHGLANSLFNLIDAANLLKNKPVAFVLVGQGAEKHNLQQKVLQFGLDKVFLLPSISKQSIPCFLQNMDALFIGLQKQSLFRFGVSPNKLMDYMMAGKPVIHAIEAGNDLVTESGCGISIPPEDPVALAQAVEQIMSFPISKLTSMGIKGKNYVLLHHDYQVLAQNFLQSVTANLTNKSYGNKFKVL
ncbi:MAG: glycosyltransferase family 4 protein [Symploca sp. SIO3E6]|nr:glycosyltransferase family 4 protein [Caldora sp. SIO3E6]